MDFYNRILEEGLPFEINKKRLLFIFFIVLLFFIGIFLYTNRSNLNLLYPQKQPTLKDENVAILYPQSPDPTGRDIYYRASNGRNDLPHSGVGVKYLSKGSRIESEQGDVLLSVATPSAELTDYIVGSFAGWESISNTNDKYLILEDKLQTRDSFELNTYFPKIRVGFSTEAIDYKKTFATALGVEDLSSMLPIIRDNTYGVKLYKIALLGSLSEEQINKLIKPGDALAVKIKTDLEKGQDMVDENGEKVAGWIFIRRYNPQTELSKEVEGITVTD